MFEVGEGDLVVVSDQAFSLDEKTHLSHNIKVRKGKTTIEYVATKFAVPLSVLDIVANDGDDLSPLFIDAAIPVKDDLPQLPFEVMLPEDAAPHLMNEPLLGVTYRKNRPIFTMKKQRGQQPETTLSEAHPQWKKMRQLIAALNNEYNQPVTLVGFFDEENAIWLIEILFSGRPINGKLFLELWQQFQFPTMIATFDLTLNDLNRGNGAAKDVYVKPMIERRIDKRRLACVL
ncbi:MAG: hypothetical protein HC892_00300 [Saprospiraceae bacterium]|nr:hypothetical protein [Saprospiraceae bacterium]